eukprot:TRINITY_DN60568_c0_g1_i1.p1 TRINITY_DN60568_c0_g1~~TRINITY_DN60568_c0_g1_i1.p1  ORF type:complete len:180 (-),score=5.23 TRINITY_DN60568_c0_g1_i1:220-759(-)
MYWVAVLLVFVASANAVPPPEWCSVTNRCNKDDDCWISTQQCWYCDINKTDPRYPSMKGQCVHEDPCQPRGKICGVDCCAGKNATCLMSPAGSRTCSYTPQRCGVSPTASDEMLQNAINWICSSTGVDCSQINSGGCCFQPNTLENHCTWAFNQYFQMLYSSQGDAACNFGGAGRLFDW